MNTPHFRIKFSAIGAPVLILLYGFLRLIDLSDGNLSHGFFWNSGHLFFFIAFVLFGFLNIELSRLFSRYNKPTQLTAFLFLAVSLSGTVCFLWGILGDLFHNVAPVPGPLKFAGPLLFQAGMLGLLIMLTAIRPRRLPVWTPILVLTGFLLFAINLNLLPLGAIIILIGLSPLVRRSLTI